MSVSGNPLPLFIEKKDKKKRVVASDASTFYNLTTNIENVLIQAELDLPMPEGTELWLTGESGLGSSHGLTQLRVGGATSIVSGISRGLENGRPLRYEFVATDAALDIPTQSRTVTLTLMDTETGQRQQLLQTVLFSATITESRASN